MKIIRDIKEFKEYRSGIAFNKSIGFVPTMGCLHIAHTSMMERSQKENNITIASIFVNPTQFNDLEDYNKYPRVLEQDIRMLGEKKIDCLFLPKKADMFLDSGISIKINNPLIEILEGKHRPGHLEGVLTIIMKFLMIVNPSKIYLGEKDYQQYALIKYMVDEYFINTNVSLFPTFRHKNKLPYSSRNARLSESGKEKANIFAKIFHNNNYDIKKIIEALQDAEIELEYLEKVGERVFVAVKIEDIRIIDNILIEV